MIDDNPYQVLEYLVGVKPGPQGSPVSIEKQPGGFVISSWDEGATGRAKPSDAEVNATFTDAGFTAWLAEHGGDAALTLHRQAKESIDASTPDSLARRAYALAVRADTTRTKTDRQLRDDAKARIDAGEVG